MKYVPIPIAMLEIGRPLPVDVWSPSGQLLLRKGQPVQSAQHKERLHAHNAGSTPNDAWAWQRAYERMVHTMMREGVDLQTIANAPMPSEILQRDYIAAEELNGGWLDLQEVLRGILYQGGLAISPLRRLAGIEKKAVELLRADTDDSLFCLFQALTDNTLGYCATHALLCAVVCELTAKKLGLDPLLRRSLFNAALTMNIGMAREQDSLARQSTAVTDWQRTLIREHPLRSMEILSAIGISDPDQLDIVRWHHAVESEEAVPHTLTARRIIGMTDGFVAKMAARKTRSSLSPVSAVKSMVLGVEGPTVGVGSAMAQAVGFYPPGSYVQLANGDTAVAVQRGERANTPWVVSVVDKDGMPVGNYMAKDTANPANAILAPVNFEKVRVAINLDKIRKARDRIRR